MGKKIVMREMEIDICDICKAPFGMYERISKSKAGEYEVHQDCMIDLLIVFGCIDKPIPDVIPF